MTAPGSIRLQIWGAWAHPPPPMGVGLLCLVQPKNKKARGRWALSANPPPVEHAEIEADIAAQLARVREMERNGELKPIPEVSATTQ